MSEAPLLELEDVHMRMGSRILFTNFSLQLHRNETVGLTGPSGSGKSTILRIAVDLITPSIGTVRCHGEFVADCDPRDIRRKLILVPQQASMFPGTVRDNLVWGMRINGLEEDEDELSNVLEEVNLNPSFLDKVAENLSGGEKQRVAIARALLLEPDALLLDEPTSALDEQSTLVVESTIKSVVEKRKIGVLIVTHNKEQAERFTDRVVVISEGGS
ncbi:MAG: ATP-binding cassette domain-containing protein [Candidatus Thorarchaeota archaeon]